MTQLGDIVGGDPESVTEKRDDKPQPRRQWEGMTHKEKMEAKRWQRDRMNTLAHQARAERGVTIRGNFSDRPKGQPRTREPGEGA